MIREKRSYKKTM